MKLSIWMISYNQRDYIAQALDSILMQKVSFEYEIIIGDDSSTDGTVAIIEQYTKLHPAKIKPTYRTSNIGMISNMIETLQQCKGEYIALCEGDDYWTDPEKLQKQISFLEKNSDYSMCFHNVAIWKNGKIIKNKLTSYEKDEYTILDFAQYNFIHTVSCVFRNNMSAFQFPGWIHKMSVGDYILHIFNSQFGKIKYINEIMGVYRIHQSNNWINDNNVLLRWSQNQEIIIENILLEDTIHQRFINMMKESVAKNFYKLYLLNYALEQDKAEKYFNLACYYSLKTVAKFVYQQNSKLEKLKIVSGYQFLMYLKTKIKNSI